ncbi:MAG: hypothetical protein HRT66_12680, partial [Flavobacteriaceae bacterium]|nr:hypothetical protein [Flavobacteriaceae bacterium]
EQWTKFARSGTPSDIDFVCWGPYDSLDNICLDGLYPKDIQDHSYSISSVEYCNLTDTKVGEIYLLLVTNFSKDPGFISIDETSGSVATTDCDIFFTLGDNKKICDNDSVELSFPNKDFLIETLISRNKPGGGTESVPFSEISWLRSEIGASSYDLIPGAKGVSYTATKGGDYMAEFKNNSTGDSAKQYVGVRLYDLEISQEELFLCGSKNIEIDYDLLEYKIKLKDNRSKIEIELYMSESDANSKINKIESIKISDDSEIWVGIENTLGGCYGVEKIKLTILGPPISNLPENIFTCDINRDGSEILYLDSLQSYYENFSEDDMEVSYYTTEDDAINEVSSISGEYKSGGKKKIWVRLSNSRSGCYDISSFYFVVSGSPLTLDLIDFSSCRDDNGIAFFDFTRNSNLIKISEPNTNITYHLSREDAEVFTGIIPEIYYSSISSTIWCRINSEDNKDCYSINFFEIRVFYSPNSVSISDIHSCDYEGLGKAEFNFADQRKSIFDQEELDVKVSFHLSLEDADSSKNSLYDVYEATNSDVYTRIESIYNKSCYIIQEFKIVVEEFEINKKIADMNLCNENN